MTLSAGLHATQPSRQEITSSRNTGTGRRPLMRFQAPVLIAVAALFSLAASAQSPRPAPRAAPRTPDDKPDLSGFWQGPLMRNFFQSTGGPPFTEEGRKAYEYNRTQSINPEGLCIFAGVPRASISGV